MSGRLDGRVALVTGIGAGIGKGIALRYAAEGATVLGCDLAADRAEQTVAEAAAAGHPLTSLHPVDLTDPDGARRYVAAAQPHGRVDILVNTAAIAPHLATTADMDYATQFRPTLAGEVDIVFLVTQAAWPLLTASGRASIINFASVNSYRGSRSMGMVAHCAGKGAVLSMTRQLAVEGGPLGIRANTISCGLVKTAATDLAGATDGELSASIVNRTLVGRLGEPEDVAWCAVYLGSDEATWVTGADFPVDGGVRAA
jgi:NAD(P)-dependent dehydrogenase (short-subunit alcohol dehydrogenase family)